MNKLIILLLSLFAANILQAQVAIEKTSLRSPEGSLLEFNDKTEPSGGVAKGIILPVVDGIDSNTVPGTLYVDANSEKVVCQANSGTLDLTPASSTDLQAPTLTENGEGVIITDDASLISSDSAPGVLKLSSNSRALLLPHVNNIDEVINPEVGTIVYDTSSKSLAVFNGVVWSFWQ